MAVVTEQAIWVNTITLIDPNDPVQGGPGGVDNVPHEQLANRTAYLKQLIESLDIPPDTTDALADEIQLRKAADDELRGSIAELLLRIKALENAPAEDTQIGELFWTTAHFLTADAVTAYKGYGTWERALQGRVAVGFSDNSEDHIDFRTHSKQYGEREHTLIINEMPKHKHSHSDKYQYYIARHHRGESVSSGDTADLQKEWQLHGQTESEFASALDEARGDNQPHNNMQPSQTLDCWKRTA